MLTHDSVWYAIEALAASKKMSCSGLARFSRLDATTFNKSKRISVDGKPRWPSMCSIAKVLSATNTSVREFAEFFPPE